MKKFLTLFALVAFIGMGTTYAQCSKASSSCCKAKKAKTAATAVKSTESTKSYCTKSTSTQAGAVKATTVTNPQGVTSAAPAKSSCAAKCAAAGKTCSKAQMAKCAAAGKNLFKSCCCNNG